MADIVIFYNDCHLQTCFLLLFPNVANSYSQSLRWLKFKLANGSLLPPPFLAVENSGMVWLAVQARSILGLSQQLRHSSFHGDCLSAVDALALLSLFPV